MSTAYFVFLDSGVWVYNTHLLRSPLGAAILRIVARAHARVGLPEVVEGEVARLAQAAAQEATEKSEPHNALLQGLSGHTIRQPIISHGLVSARFIEIGVLITRFPYQDSHGREALRRVMAEEPPNAAKNQQYKDTLLWLAILDAASQAPVHFIATDKAFFQSRDYSKGLAENLRTDATRLQHQVSIYSDVGDCLRSLRAVMPALDISVFLKATLEEVRSTFARQSAARQEAFGKRVALRGSAFATEDPTIVALDLHLGVESEFAVDEGIGISGTVEFHITAEGSVLDYSLSSPRLEGIRYHDASGEYLFAQAFLYSSESVRSTAGPTRPRRRFDLD